MKVTCPDCKLKYDDARRLTFCPHDPLMSDEHLEQKDAGLALQGKDVRFAHEAGHGKIWHVESCNHIGQVALKDMPGWFAPHLFVEVTHDPAP